jgi:hypothetical protein
MKKHIKTIKSTTPRRVPLNRAGTTRADILPPPATEQVDHPSHYGGKHNPYEAIKVIEAWRLNFNLGSMLKYIARLGQKDDPIVELKKARFYLTREIELREGKIFTAE